MRFPERRTANVLLTILLFAAVCAVAYCARYVILLFVLSVFFAYLMNPAVRFLQQHSLFSRHLRGAAVVEAYVGILILIAIAGHTFAPALVRNTVKFVDAVPLILDRLPNGELAGDIGDKFGWSDEQKERLKTVLVRHKENFHGLQSWIDSSISQAARIVVWMALIPILAIFLLRDGNRIVETAITMVLPESQHQPARTFACELHKMLSNYMRVQVLLCLFSLGFYLPVLLLFRFPHAVGLAFLGGMLEFIPVFGWMTTAAVIVGVGIANNLHWVWMSALLLLWRVTQDYFNLPRALGHRLEIHPLTIIFAVLAGGEVGGIIGIYLAVPISALLFLIWRLRTSSVELKSAEPLLPEVQPSYVEMTRD